MPIFEDGERITRRGLKKAQKEYNEKMFRLEAKKMGDEEDNPPPVFDGGDLPNDPEELLEEPDA